MIEELLKVLLDGRGIRALNAGYEAVVSLLVDTCDSWLRTICPAYALAADAADIAGPDKIKALKVLALTQALKELGLDQILRALVEQWQKAPSTIREAAALYADAGQDARLVWADPSINNIYNLIANRLPDAYRFAEHVIGQVLAGNLELENTADWAFGFAEVANDKVAGLLDKWHLPVVAAQLRSYGGPATQLAITAVDVPLNAIDESWANVVHGDIDGIISDLTGIGVAIESISLVKDVGSAVASSAIAFSNEVAKLPGEVVAAIKKLFVGSGQFRAAASLTICRNGGHPVQTLKVGDSSVTRDMTMEQFQSVETTAGIAIKDCISITI